jgi:hypothetical protein
MLNNNCELYQQLLSTPDNELSSSQRGALKWHLQECSACTLYAEKSHQLCSLLNRLPASDIEFGLPPQLDALIKRSEEEVAGTRNRQLTH